MACLLPHWPARATVHAFGPARRPAHHPWL